MEYLLPACPELAQLPLMHGLIGTVLPMPEGHRSASGQLVISAPELGQRPLVHLLQEAVAAADHVAGLVGHRTTNWG